MKRIQSDEATAFRERWAMVARQEERELRETPIETRFRQFSALFASRALFAEDPAAAAEQTEVRERWNRIRAALNDR
ncbi:MAG: hypothetical protein MUC71_05860 [Steroidobacteraceae bacterium]|jgi:hypothetical protein|nr:hypothetical protein [Steroidobacteraceae bacterium]